MNKKMAKCATAPNIYDPANSLACMKLIRQYNEGQHAKGNEVACHKSTKMETASSFKE